MSKQNQTRTLYVQSSHNPMSGCIQPVVQITHLGNQSPYLTYHVSLQNSATQAEQISTSRTDPSIVELLNQ